MAMAESAHTWSAQNRPSCRRDVARRAFVDSLPVLMGYTTMGFVAGVLLAAKGNLQLSPLWAFLTSSLWVTGTMSIAGVPEIARRAPALAIALMTLAVNFRYAFYGRIGHLGDFHFGVIKNNAALNNP